MERRVVITGLGMITPLGNSVKENWQKILAGTSGIGPLTHFNPDDFNPEFDFPRFAGEVRDFDPLKWGMPLKTIRHSDLFSQYAVAAAKDALSDSGIDLAKENLYRIGVIIGCIFGGGKVWEEQARILFNPEKGLAKVSNFFIPMILTSMPASHITMVLGIKGVHYAVNSACASSTNAIGEAADKIRFGRLDVALAGGTDSFVIPMGLGSLNNLGALSRHNSDPKRASRPFDRQRDGFVLSEGAGIMVLEELERAKARGANIYAEIIGYGATSDALHITVPSVEGQKECMRAALLDAKLNFDSVEYINAHGTATPVGDKNETMAIKSLFNGCAYKLFISSTKSMTGHMLGATGAVEAGYTALALKNGVIPPTTNLEEKDPDCDLDYVPNQAREKKISIALSNSFGFGGPNSCLALRSF